MRACMKWVIQIASTSSSGTAHVAAVLRKSIEILDLIDQTLRCASVSWSTPSTRLTFNAAVVFAPEPTVCMKVHQRGDRPRRRELWILCAPPLLLRWQDAYTCVHTSEFKTLPIFGSFAVCMYGRLYQIRNGDMAMYPARSPRFRAFVDFTSGSFTPTSRASSRQTVGNFTVLIRSFSRLRC